MSFREVNRASKTNSSSFLTIGGPPHFSLLGIPIRVGFSFWLIAFLYSNKSSFSSILVSIVIIFVSILIHELGHALVARKFGAQPAITLHMMGGLTTFVEVPMSRWRRVLISFAGPFAGLATGVLVYFTTRNLVLSHSQQQILHLILWANIGWSLLNLLPVLPFDGGNIVAAALGPERTFATAVISASVSLLIALCGAIYLHNTTGLFLAVLFGSAAFSSILQARMAWSLRVDTRNGLDILLARARLALEHGDLELAQSLVENVLHHARTAPVRNSCWATLAWVYVLQKEGIKARAALRNVTTEDSIDPYTWAAVEDSVGNTSSAIEILEEVRSAGLQNADILKLLIDMYARTQRFNSAIEIAIEDAHFLPPEDVRTVMVAALDHKNFEGAAHLASRLFELHGSIEYAIDEARAWAKAHDVDKLLEALLKAVTTGKTECANLKNDPDFLAFVDDARFQKIWGS